MRIAIAVFWIVVRASAAQALDITQCGQRVPDGGSAVLQTDLTCPPAGFCQLNTGGPIGTAPCVSEFDCPSPSEMHCRHFAILLGRHATLALNGHTIAGTHPAVGVNPGVLCDGDGASSNRCAVSGPGTVTGFYEGIYVTSGKATVEHVTVTDNEYGILALEGLKTRLIANDVTASGNVYGILAATMKGTTIDASGNSELGLYAGNRSRIEDLTANGNGEVGVLTQSRGKFDRLTATGNGGPGIAVVQDAKLRDSTLTGNNGGGAGDDVLAATVRLVRTTCGKSAALILSCTSPFECTYDAGPTLGLCGGD